MSVAELVAEITDAWVADLESDVVWAGDFEGRRGVRMRQTVRDFTTVWFRAGERTVSVEAYVMPSPSPDRATEVYRLCLSRNTRSRRIHFAIDDQAEVVLVGRVPVAEIDADEMELILAEVYEMVEITFRPLVRLGFAREKKA